MDTYPISKEQPKHQQPYQDLFNIEEGHLTDKDVYGFKESIWDITLPVGMTLEKLEAEHPDGVYWELPPDIQEFLKHNKRIRNRTNATKEDMEGDLRKGLFLSAEIIKDWNDSTVSFNLDIDHLVPGCVNTAKRTNWTIQGNQPQGSVYNNMSIFEPDSYFGRKMYETKQRYGLDTLKEDIRLDWDDKKKETVAMRSHGAGWEKVLLNRNNPALAEDIKFIEERNAHIMENPLQKPEAVAIVPYALGEAIFDKLAEPLKEIEGSYADFTKLRCKFGRADGLPWNSLVGLVADANASENRSVGTTVQHNLHKPINAGAKIRFRYILD